MIQPPGEHRHERTADVFGRECPLFSRPSESERVDILGRQFGDGSMNALEDERAAVVADDGLIETQVRVRMLEHRETEAERGGLTLALEQQMAEVLEPAAEQRLLVGKVRIERRAADIGAVDNILHGCGFVPLLHDQGDKRILQ